MLYITVVVAVFFGTTNSGFFGIENVRSLMLTMSTTGIVGVGISMLLISGENDLASGAEAALSGIIAVHLIQLGVPWPIAVVITIAFGMLLGFILSLLVNKVGLFTFIASVSMISVYQGFSKIFTGNQNISVDLKYESFFVLGSGTIFGVLPVPFVIMVVLMVVYGFILHSTNLGRSIYMCGGNRRAAHLSGINRKKITTLLFMNNSAIAALAGVLVAARMHNASPVACESAATDAITAAVLGGVAFGGGAGNIGNCFIGALLLTIFNSGLTSSGLGSYWQIVVQGLLLLVALTVDFFSSRARAKALEAA